MDDKERSPSKNASSRRPIDMYQLLESVDLIHLYQDLASLDPASWLEGGDEQVKQALNLSGVDEAECDTIVEAVRKLRPKQSEPPAVTSAVPSVSLKNAAPSPSADTAAKQGDLPGAAFLKALIEEVKLLTAALAGKNVLVLAGGTGAGKTTTMHWLLGHTLALHRSGDGTHQINCSCDSKDGDLKIGHGESQTHTAAWRELTLRNDETVFVVDTPGDRDTDRSIRTLLRNSLLRSFILGRAAKVRMVLLLQIEQIAGARNTGLVDALEGIASLYESAEQAAGSICVLVSPMSHFGDLSKLESCSTAELEASIALPGEGLASNLEILKWARPQHHGVGAGPNAS